MRSRNPLLIDTFPLVEFIFYRCFQEFGWQFAKKEVTVLTESNIAKFEKFLKGYRIYTTPGVITELQCHQRTRLQFLENKNKQHRRFWSLVLSEFANLPITEKYISLENVSHDLVVQDVVTQFGPTDASLFKIAKDGDMRILLKDVAFAGYCEKQKPRIYTINFQYDWQ
jgi:hypothetical protein